MATSAQINAIVALYAGYFDRAPDPAGLQFWIDQIDAGRDFATIAQDFANGPEAKALYPFLTVPDVATASTFVTAVYQNLFGRAPDAEGLAFWTKVIEDQTVPVGDMIQAIINGAVTDPDATVLANKAEAGLDFATQAGDTPGFVYDAAAAAAAKAVMDGITADPATVDAAKAATDVFLGGVENIGTTYQLTTGVDNVPGTTANDIINGHVDTIANGGTFNGVDNIDGSIGVDTMNLSVIDDSVWPAAALVKNVEILNVRNVDATPTSLSLGGFTGLQQAWSKGSTADTTFTSASTATTFGLVGTTDLTVDFATTSGKTDTANLALAGVGTSAAARSTVNVADGNTVEAVTVAASGTNFVNLEAGSAAATITLTGDATNNINVVSAAGSMTLDASTSTGANTFVVGSVLSTTDTIKGGTGADTVSANLTVPTLINPTMTGVETMTLDFDADATLNLSKTTGLTTVNLAGSTGNQTITNAAADLTTVNITSQGDTDNDLNLSYGKGVSGDLTVNIGGAADITMDDFGLVRADTLTINAVGSKANAIDDVSTGSLSALNINVGAGGDLSAGDFESTGDIGAITIDVGADGTSYTNWISAGSGSDIGSIDMTVAEGGSGEAYIAAYYGGEIGDVTLTANGDDAQAYLDVSASAGSGDHNIGNGTLTVTGDDASGYLELYASSGSVGDITVNATGTGVSAYVSAYASAGEDADGYDTLGGDIGNVSITGTGTDAYVSAYIDSSAGDIGNIDMSITGEDSYLHVSAITYAASIDASGASDNGNIGNVTLTVDGENAYGSGYVSAGSGNVGDVTVNVGDGASGIINVYAAEWGSSGASAGASGDIGNVSVTVGDDAYVSAYIDGSGSVGDTVVTGGDNASAEVNISGYDGTVGDMTITMGDDATLSAGLDSDGSPFDDGIGVGDIGNVSITVGADSDVNLDLESYSGNMGTVDITAGPNSDIYVSGVTENASAFAGDAGDLTITGGSGTYVSANYDLEDNAGNFSITADEIDLDVYASGDIGLITLVETIGGGDSGNVYASGDSVSEIDTTGFHGDVTIDLSDVALGTTISVGNGGSEIDGTDGADNIFGGTGVDVIRGGTGVDTMEGKAGADVFDFTDVDGAASAGAVTDVISDFVSGTDKLEFDSITGDYAEELTAAATFVDLLSAADTALDGTVDFYFGVFNGNGYLFADEDGGDISTIIELTGVTDMADTDLV